MTMKFWYESPREATVEEWKEFLEELNKCMSVVPTLPGEEVKVQADGRRLLLRTKVSSNEPFIATVLHRELVLESFGHMSTFHGSVVIGLVLYLLKRKIGEDYKFKLRPINDFDSLIMSTIHKCLLQVMDPDEVVSFILEED